MSQFDVYRNADTTEAKTFPYLLNVQSDLLEHLATRVVVPLIRAEAVDASFPRLNPRFVIEGIPVAMLTPQIRGVTSRRLGSAVTSLADRRHEIIAAIDVVVSGV
jgi:toxin CcdB